MSVTGKNLLCGFRTQEEARQTARKRQKVDADSRRAAAEARQAAKEAARETAKETAAAAAAAAAAAPASQSPARSQTAVHQTRTAAAAAAAEAAAANKQSSAVQAPIFISTALLPADSPLPQTAPKARAAIQVNAEDSTAAKSTSVTNATDRGDAV